MLSKKKMKKTASAKPTKRRAQTVRSRVPSTGSPAATANQKKKELQPSLEDQVQAVLASLARLADKRVFEDMSKRYGIYTSKAFGVSMSNIQKVAKPLGRNHALAAALCLAVGEALVSTSANVSRRPPHRRLLRLRRDLGRQVDYVLAGPLGNLAEPTRIRDGRSGRILRP